MQTRELDHVFADQVGGVLAPPALRFVVAVGEQGFRKAAALQQTAECVVRSGALLLAPFAHGHRVQAKRQVAPGQRLA